MCSYVSDRRCSCSRLFLFCLGDFRLGLVNIIVVLLFLPFWLKVFQKQHSSFCLAPVWLFARMLFFVASPWPRKGFTDRRGQQARGFLNNELRTGGAKGPRVLQQRVADRRGQQARGFLNNELRTGGGSRPAGCSTTSCGQEGQKARSFLNYQGVTVELYSAYDLSVSD